MVKLYGEIKENGEGQTNTKVKEKLVQNKKVKEKVSGKFSVWWIILFGFW